MEKLGTREAGPEPNRLSYGPRGDVESLRKFLVDWTIWKSIHEDSFLTVDERDVWFHVVSEQSKERRRTNDDEINRL